MNELLSMTRRLAREAGKILGDSFVQPFEICHKGTIDLVTSADKASEEHVISAIGREYPDHDIVAEESGNKGAGGPYRWVIDPLDGTVNFAHRIPHFCVLIAVQERVGLGRYETLYGVTYDPLRDEEFVAIRGGGATLNGRSIAVSQTQELLHSMLCTGFGYDRLTAPNDNHAEFCRLNLISQGVRRLGSAGLDLAYVACGRFDMYWEYRLNVWDMTPGVLLVTEAGGTVSNLQGGPIIDGTLIASNSHLHTISLAALESAAHASINSRRGLEKFLPREVAQRLQQ